MDPEAGPATVRPQEATPAASRVAFATESGQDIAHDASEPVRFDFPMVCVQTCVRTCIFTRRCLRPFLGHKRPARHLRDKPSVFSNLTGSGVVAGALGQRPRIRKAVGSLTGKVGSSDHFAFGQGDCGWANIWSRRLWMGEEFSWAC